MKILNNFYWQERYETHQTGWDTGRITTPLKEYIDQLSKKDLKILIPGCGNAYEFEYLIQKNFTNIHALDYASAPINHLKEKTPNTFHENIYQVDFFTHEEEYDLIIEQTFFCALSPELRESYVKKMHQLLKPNGKLIGLLFQFPLSNDGPPFGGSKELYEQLFLPYFHIKTLETAHNSIKPRKGNELFFIFTKK